jgi:transcription-repair coupling factor (superfamily II helicase)
MRVVKSHAKRGAQFTPQGVFKYPLKATRPDELLLELRELISSLEPATAIRA